jgi:carboxypeptidase Taq
MKESLLYIYKEQREISNLSRIEALLEWDQKTVMPPSGSKERAEQISLISRLAHEKFISEDLYKHVKILSLNLKKLKEKDRRVVLRLKKDVDKARKVPPEFIERFSKTTSLAYSAWEKAKKGSNFSLFSPHLEKIVELERQYCEYMDLPGHPYNSLLDDYEEGMRVERLKKEFRVLRQSLTRMLEYILSSKAYQKISIKKLDTKEQEKICRFIFKKMNLSSKSRLDISAHPFTSQVGASDVRITTNYERQNPFSSLLSTLHEIGHALYDLGLPRDFRDTVIYSAPSYGLHESQSRFWENMIARSKSFWRYLVPILKSSQDAEDLYRYVNQVIPSPIRVDADELTYCLHIILRFELEMDLLEGNIEVTELPNFWNEKMKEFLEITPENDKEGVLQDMHWSCGEFGYFPSYAIGAIYAAQLFKRLLEEKGDVMEEVERGNFRSIIWWLKENIHKYGRLLSAEEIIKRVCGEGLNSKVFINYLKEKYYSIYA